VLPALVSGCSSNYEWQCDEHFGVKVSDFGTSRVIDRSRTMTLQGSSPLWTAPGTLFFHWRSQLILPLSQRSWSKTGIQKRPMFIPMRLLFGRSWHAR
jgi:hypothetical protein